MKIENFIKIQQSNLTKNIDLAKVNRIFFDLIGSNALIIFSKNNKILHEYISLVDFSIENIDFKQLRKSIDSSFDYFINEEIFEKQSYFVLCVYLKLNSKLNCKKSLDIIIQNEFILLSNQKRINYLEAKASQEKNLIKSTQKNSKIISRQNSEYQSSLEDHFIHLEDTIKKRTFDLNNQLKIIQFKNQLLQLISNASSEHTDFFNKCCPLISDFMSVERTSIWVHDENLKELSIIHGDGLKQNEKISVKNDIGFVGKCYLDKKTHITNDPYSDDTFFKSIDKSTGFLTKNVLVTPIMKGEKVLGVLQLLNKSGDFLRVDLDLSQRIASTMINHLRVFEIIASDRAAKYELEALLSTIPDVVYKISKSGKFEYVSKSIEKWGYKPLELINKHYSILFGEPRPTKFARNEVLDEYKESPESIPKSPPKLFDERRAGERATKELEVEIKSGKHIENEIDIIGEVSASGYWVSNERTLQKEFKGTIGIIRDITKRVLAQSNLEKTKATLVQAERFASLGTLAAGIAHDFNNLLGIILMGIELQNTAGINLSDERKKSTNDKVMGAITKATSLTQRLLSIARSNEPKIENCSLNDIITEAISLMENRFLSSGISLVYNNIAIISNCMVDKNQLNDVLINILTNSIHAIEECENEDLLNRKVGIELSEVNGAFSIELWDTGKGIDEKDRNKIFDPFFTTKNRISQKGTGLGLAMVFAFIESHKAQIEVNSFTVDEKKPHPFCLQAESGTVFHLSLPKLKLDSLIEIESIEIKSNERALKAEILVLDDEDIYLDMVQFGLEHYNFKNIKTFQSSEDLLKYLDETKNIPDIIISDIHMPPPSGIKVFKIVQEKYAGKVKTIAMTGKLVDDLSEELSDLKVENILSKPFLVSDLKDIIFNMFRE
ncbi:MAG: hypothetical protein COB02_11525 [Candidatus Cloacimonadota bacterium]|nr:MAG: hypothetical protein COB02_11525 [Candidatus Cloacimonadota bacterium]